MSIVIGPGIEVGGGVTISAAPSAMRALLSPAGQTAYDAATVDGWFSVSAADYGNVRAGLTGTSTIAYSDANLSSASNVFSGNFGATVNITNATVNTGNYILGLASKGSGTGNLTFRPYVSTTFRGTYSTIGTGNLVILQSQSATVVYWLRKNPSAPVASTSYVAVGPGTGGMSWLSMGPWGGNDTNGGAYSGTMSSGGWTTFNSAIPAQQWLLTDTQQW